MGLAWSILVRPSPTGIGTRPWQLEPRLMLRAVPTVLYTAAVLCPMSRPPLAAGGVLVDGERVAAVGEAARLRPDAGREVRHDGVLLPGLVDARTAVELADAAGAGGAAPASAAALEATRGWDAERWSRSARRGVHALVRAGATACGDVVLRGAGVPACVRAGLAGDSWLRIAGVDRTEHDAVVAAAARSLARPAPGRRIGLSPEPLALSTGVLQALAALAAERAAPVHVATAGDETEREAIASGRGPVAERARRSGLSFEWLEAPTRRTPLGYLDALGLLTPHTSIACARDVTSGEARALARRGVTVVCCPSAPGGHDAPLERFAQAGTPLALSSGGGDVLAAAAGWVAQARRRGLARWPAAAGPLELEEAAVRLATSAGAAAMGWGEVAGTLAAGRRADLVVLDLDTTPERAYADVALSGAGRQVLTVLAGVRRARRPSADDPWPAHDDPPPPGAAGGGAP